MTSGSPDPVTDESFERRLWRFLLVAYASGEDVEGVRYLTDDDRFVPDFRVVVEPAQPRVDVRAAPEPARHGPAGPSSFSERLRAFVLEQFARGVDVEGTWTLRFPRAHLPDWTVRISIHAEAETVGGARSPDSGR